MGAGTPRRLALRGVGQERIGVVGERPPALDAERILGDTQEHDLDAEVTENPVEDGAAVIDHISVKAWTLSISGIIAYHPLVEPGTQAEPGRVKNVWDAIETAIRDKQLVTVDTGLKTYSNMAITKLSTRRDVNSGKNIPVAISFREVRLAKAKSELVPRDAIGKAGPGASTSDGKAQIKDTQALATQRKDKGLVTPSALPASSKPVDNVEAGLQGVNLA